MPLFAVLAVGADRPGIVAAVTRVLADRGANLDDTSMTVLHGHFAMALVVRAPGTADELSGALAPVAGPLDLVVTVREIDETPPPPAGERWSVSVYGADRPGIVATVAEALAAEGANIVDLTTRVVGGADRPVYAMALEVALPPGADGDAVSTGVREAAASVGVDVSLHPIEAEIL